MGGVNQEGGEIPRLAEEKRDRIQRARCWIDRPQERVYLVRQLLLLGGWHVSFLEISPERVFRDKLSSCNPHAGRKSAFDQIRT